MYCAYHDQFLKNLQALASKKRPIVVVGWDNTAHYHIGNNEAGQEIMMRPFILSNKGQEGQAHAKVGEAPTCDPRFLEEFAHQLHRSLKTFGLPDEVYLNLVYKGGYIPQHYNTHTYPALEVDRTVEAFQVEYDTLLTHDQATLAPNFQNMERLRVAFEQAMHNAYVNLLTHAV